MKLRNSDLKGFIRYSIVGLGNTIVNWLIFFILNEYGVYYVISNIVCFFANSNAFCRKIVEIVCPLNE